MSLHSRYKSNWKARQAEILFKYAWWKFKRAIDTSKKIPVEGISLVVVGRNDNYGGDFSDRLRVTIDWNYGHLPNPELIYVEWNQIPERESDTKWIAERYENCKCFIVPNDIHKDISSNPKIPMMEYFAKNIGIRESTNDWVAVVNADVLLGPEVFPELKELSKQHIYGTHYRNIRWEGEPITEQHFTNKDILLNSFPTSMKLDSVVGNFLLTHKDNWLRSGGYDESLTDVRIGVDNNGRDQLLHLGFKPMVLGSHFHLDHGESSITNKNNATHGNRASLIGNIPYKNPDNWGFKDYPKKQIADKIWVLQKT